MSLNFIFILVYYIRYLKMLSFLYLPFHTYLISSEYMVLLCKLLFKNLGCFDVGTRLLTN